MKRNEDRDLWDNSKGTNICIIGVPEGGEREIGPKNVFADTRAENFPNLEKENTVLSRQPHDTFGNLNVVILKPESCIIFILTQDVV